MDCERSTLGWPRRDSGQFAGFTGVVVLLLMSAALATGQGGQNVTMELAILPLEEVEARLQQLNVTSSFGNCVTYAASFYNISVATDPQSSDQPLASDFDSDGVMPFYQFVFQNHIQTGVNTTAKATTPTCDQLSSSELFCSVVYDTQNVCTPAMMTSDAATGLCLHIYYIHGLLAPLLLSNQVTLVPWMVSLATRFCPLRNFSKCVESRVQGNVAVHSCPFPYVFTENEELADFGFSDNVASSYQYVTLKNTNQSVLLPICALNCNSFIQETGKSRFLSNYVRVIYAAQTLLPALVLIAAIRSGLRATWEYPNRLMIYLAIAVFIFGQALLPHFMEPIIGVNVACNSDESLRSSEQLRQSSWSFYSVVLLNFTQSVYQWILFFVSLGWWQLVLKLEASGSRRWYIFKVNGLFEIIYFFLVAVWGGVFTGLYSREYFAVGPVIHITVAISGLSEWGTGAPNILLAAIAFLLLIDGFRRLRKIHSHSTSLRQDSLFPQDNQRQHHQNSTSVRLSTVSTTSESSSLPLSTDVSVSRRSLTSANSCAPHKTKGDRTMVLLLRRFKFYILAVVLMSSAELIFRYSPGAVGAMEQLQTDLAQYAKCSVAYCGDPSADCDRLAPRIPNVLFATAVVFDSMSFINALLLCSWVLTPAAWKSRESKKQRLRSQKKTQTMSNQFPSMSTGGLPLANHADGRYISVTPLPLGHAAECKGQTTVVASTMMTDGNFKDAGSMYSLAEVMTSPSPEHCALAVQPSSEPPSASSSGPVDGCNAMVLENNVTFGGT